MARILILANSDLGLYKFRKELIEELLIGNEVYISLPNGGYIKDLVHLGCKFIETRIDRRGINPINDAKLLLHYLKIATQIKPDQVITYTVKPNVYGGIVCRIKRIPYVINITGLGSAFQNEGLLKKMIVNLYKLACAEAKVVFFENKENQKKFISYNIVPKGKTYKLNGAGVNLEEYPFSTYPSGGNEIRFLFIGRVMKEKGIDEFLDVAQRIKEKHKNVQFDIVGPEEDSYRKKLENFQNANIINYYGYQANIKPFVERAHCFVLPSYHEGMANTLLESGAMGRPLIASDIPGCREAILDGESGYVVKVRSTEDLYAKITEFINLTYEDKKRMAQNSRNYIQQNFDKSKVVEETVKMLSKKNIDWRGDNGENTNFTI